MKKSKQLKRVLRQFRFDRTLTVTQTAKEITELFQKEKKKSSESNQDFLDFLDFMEEKALRENLKLIEKGKLWWEEMLTTVKNIESKL